MDGSNTVGILLILGIGVFGGLAGAWVFQRIRIPQVIGYIVIGLLLGESGFGILRQETLPSLRPFSYLALAVIGFLVGGELEKSLFREHGKRFLGILAGEGLGAFFLVGAGAGLLLYLVTADPTVALAGGVVFGAIASATDPASTLDVLWEYRAKGPLTSSLVPVVAMDDALAMILYAFGTALAAVLAGSGASVGGMIGRVLLDLGGSVLLGAATGALLDAILRRSKSSDCSLTVVVGSLLLLAGTCLALDMDVILCAMSAGITLVNLEPRRSKALFKTVRAFAAPIQVMFFVLVGARLYFGAMPLWVWALVMVYVLGRTGGKYAGARLGAQWTAAPELLQRYLGLGLLAQGGVAVGLSMMASQHLTGLNVHGDLDLGALVVTTVTATTLIVQVMGPPCVKLAITRADEAGRNITEEDLIGELTVADVLQTQVDMFRESDRLSAVFAAVSQSSQLSFPVSNAEGLCTGVISLNALKSIFLEREIWDWMIAGDVMIPFREDVRPSMPLEDALRVMRQLQAEQTVVRDETTGTPLGIFDLRVVQHEVACRLLARQGRDPAADVPRAV
jgi:Kef-type K+ transport system membrane component KefB/CBS domain-containing protein